MLGLLRIVASRERRLDAPRRATVHAGAHVNRRVVVQDADAHAVRWRRALVRHLLHEVLDPARACPHRVVQPAVHPLDATAWSEVDTIISGQLAQRPPALRRQLGALLGLVQWLPALRYGRPFTALDAARRARVLAALERAPTLLLRRGIWGLRTLALL